MPSVAKPTDLIQRIHLAEKRLRSVINPTPLLEFETLNQRVGGRVLLKPENLQRAGSFKIRGAYNAIAALPEANRERGVIAWSSGNHAQGVALAAALFDISATIVMPSDAPELKRAAVVALGAEIVAYDRYSEDREAIAKALARERQCPLIPSYDHWDVIAGQGSIGLEIMRDPAFCSSAPDQVFVCCGGGGLAAGIATAVHDIAPQVSVYAVEPDAADDTRRSFEAGERLSNPPATESICDALLTPTPGRLTFPVNQRELSGVLTVSDEAALRAVGYAATELRLIVEPGGAVALAALLGNADLCANKTTVVTLSGGNIDSALLAKAIATQRAE
ncbi:MAG: threonine/serine dehydratase [Pseudomonadota bacterium]